MVKMTDVVKSVTNKNDFAGMILDNFVEYISDPKIKRNYDHASTFLHHLNNDDEIDNATKVVYNHIVLNMFSKYPYTGQMKEVLDLGDEIKYVEVFKFVEKFNVEHILSKEQVCILRIISEYYDTTRTIANKKNNKKIIVS